MSILRTRNKNTNQWEEIQAIKGDQGIQGPPGPDGPPGADYEITQEDYQEIANKVETDIQPTLNNKVDKISGKELSTNDFTDAYKTKVDNNTSARHTHSNKTAIDSISSSDINHWNAKADPEDIPTNTSQLNNNSGFITKEVNNLTNYQLKTSTGSLISMEINSSNYVVTVNLKNSAGTVLSTASVDLPLETVVVDGHYDNTTKKVILTLKNGSTIEFSVADLVAGLQTEITSANKLDSDLVDDSNSGHKFVTTSEKQTWNDKYDKPSGGIPKTDLTSDVQTSLSKADSAIQEHQDLSDYVKFTDYGNNTDTAGVSRGGNYGFRISGAGVGYVQKASNAQVIGKENAYCPIVPYTLDLAVKTSISTNEIELTDEEKETAHNWLGIDEIIASATGSNLQLKGTQPRKIPNLTLFGKSSQTVNTGSNLIHLTEDIDDYFFVNKTVVSFGTYTFVQNNGASLYFPEGSKSSGTNTRILVKELNLEADKWYTVTVNGGEDAGYGMNISEYPENPADIYARTKVLSQGRNFTWTFKTEANKVYMLELRTPTAGEGGAKTEPFTMDIMVNEGAPKDWEPYTNGVATPSMTSPSAISNLTNETLTITDGVNTQTAILNLENGGIPVSSGGNYTDEEGQQYIADSIERYEDGTGKLIKRVYTQNLPNTFTKSNSSGNFLLAVSNLDYTPKLPSSQYAISYDVMCNQFTNSETWISQNGYVVVDGTKVSFADATEFNTYFAEHPLEYAYVLDTPIETDLTAEQLEQLDLATYNGETTITSNAGVEVEYIANTKQYVDDKIETGLMNRDKYDLLADYTVTDQINTPINMDVDMYDDILVVADNLLGSSTGNFNIGCKLSNSADFFTANQGSILTNDTVKNYIAKINRYLPYKWEMEKRGAANAIADIASAAIQPETQWKDKIKEVKIYTGNNVYFIQGRIRVYGRKRF